MTDSDDDTADTDEGGVLSPDELDITDEENVTEIGDGRYVISPGEGPPNVRNELEESTQVARTQDPAGEIGLDVVHEWLESHFEDSSSEFGFDVTAQFEGRVEQNALFSNDVVATFENLVSWYAHHAGGDTPVEDVLGILLVESNLTVRLPAESLAAFAEAHDLDESDSVARLYEVVKEAGGVTFDP